MLEMRRLCPREVFKELTNTQLLDMTQSFLGRGDGAAVDCGVLRERRGRSLPILETNTFPWKIINGQAIYTMNEAR